MRRFLQDLNYAARNLLKRPGFTAVAVISLALGIGAVTTVYTMVSAVILNPLPFDEGERILSFMTMRPSRGGSGFSVSYADFRDWQEQSQTFEHIAGFSDDSLNLSGPEGPERVSCGRVSASFFPMLRIQPRLGRFFLPEETRPGGNTVTVLSHALWERRYSSNPDIVGQGITIHGKPFTVIGVAPASFRFLETGPVDLWISIREGSWFTDRRDSHWMRVMGRLNDGVTQEEALSEMRVIAARISEEYPNENADKSVDLVDATRGSLGNARTSTLILFGSVGFVLLIACANVANLLLARATARQKEIAIRIALGATRSRLIRQLLTESLLLALLGGAFGMLVAFWGNDYVISTIPEYQAEFIVEYFNYGFKPDVFLFAACAVVVTAVLFGLAPALKASNPDVNAYLKEGGAAGLGKGRYRLLAALVVSEVSLALVLLVGAGLMIRSFQQLQEVDPGFDTDHLLISPINLPQATYKDNATSLDFYKRLLERIEALPGVEKAGPATIIPFTNSNNNNAIHVEGYPPLPPGQYYLSETRVTTSEYFRTLGIPLLTGRFFDRTDWDSTVRVALVNEAFKKKYWPDGDALGKRFKFGTHASDNNWITVIGVGGDVYRRLEQKPYPKLYRYLVQEPSRGMNLVLRTSVDPGTVAPSLRDAVASLDANLPLDRVTTMDQLMEDSVWDDKMMVSLFSIFAVVALILATVGVYGVINYTVAQRTHEFGIRMALGAQPSNVRHLVTLQGLRMAGIGVAIGLACAFGLTRLMVSMLYEIEPSDPLTYGVVGASLAAVVLIASYIPAQRATKVDPMIALRYE